MLNIEDKTTQPSLSALATFINLPLFDELCSLMESTYQALCKIEYSGDKNLLGWNVKFKKAGKTLCTVYPRAEYFHLLLVIGPKEKAQTEALLPTLGEAFQSTYQHTKEGMGQRWLLFDFTEHDAAFDDVMKIVEIRRHSR